MWALPTLSAFTPCSYDLSGCKAFPFVDVESPDALAKVARNSEGHVVRLTELLVAYIHHRPLLLVAQVICFQEPNASDTIKNTSKILRHHGIVAASEIAGRGLYTVSGFKRARSLHGVCSKVH